MPAELLTLKRTLVVTAAHENGRFCGCDASELHPCEGHGEVRDVTESVIEVQPGEDAIAIAVTGPVDNCITLRQGDDTIVMHRFIAELVIAEMERRLAQRV